ncbi:MAG: hypothetical protein Kow0037_00580 [Calditrichia bacterium]
MFKVIFTAPFQEEDVVWNNGLPTITRYNPMELDWSDYVIGIGPLSRRVESSQPHRPGLTVFDNVELEIPLHHTGVYFDRKILDEVRTAAKRYMFRLYAVLETEYEVFNGMLDFNSIEYSDADTVIFEVGDLLTALTYINEEKPRNYGNLLENRLDRFANPLVDQIRAKVPEDGTDGIAIFGVSQELGGIWIDQTEALFHRTEVLVNPDNGENGLITYAELKYSDLYHVHYTQIKLYGTNQFVGTYNNLNFYDLFYGRHIGIYSNNTAIYLDAIKLLRAIINYYWTDEGFVNESGWSEFAISLDYYTDLITNIFSKHPLEVLKWLANMMRVYLYFNRTGHLVIKRRLLNGPTDYIILPDIVLKQRLRYSWQQQIDYLLVKATTPTGSVEEAERPENASFKPRHQMEVECIMPTQDGLQALADEIWDYYNTRRAELTVTLPLKAYNLSLEPGNIIEFYGSGSRFGLVGITINLESGEMELNGIEMSATAEEE